MTHVPDEELCARVSGRVGWRGARGGGCEDDSLDIVVCRNAWAGCRRRRGHRLDAWTRRRVLQNA
jgi:hypothetical protein